MDKIEISYECLACWYYQSNQCIGSVRGSDCAHCAYNNLNNDDE